MVLTEFQQLNLRVFPDELFAIEPEETLEKIDDHDDSGGVVMQSSSSRHP